MKTCNTLNIVTNSNGIVRVYADGGMVFEIQADYVKTESYVACDKPVASGTVPKAKQHDPKRRDAWCCGKYFYAKIDELDGIYKCVEYDISKGWLMIGESHYVSGKNVYATELDICRKFQPATDEGSFWKSKSWPDSMDVLIAKPGAMGRIMLEESDFEPMSAEEKYRRENWEMQPEAVAARLKGF